MKTLTITLLIAISGCAEAQAGWLHRTAIAVDVAACAASAADGVSTKVVINAGGEETNPLFTGPNRGNISWPKLIGYKAIACALPYVLHAAYHHVGQNSNAQDESAIATGLAATGLYTWATWHNIDLAQELVRRNRAISTANLR